MDHKRFEFITLLKPDNLNCHNELHAKYYNQKFFISSITSEHLIKCTISNQMCQKKCKILNCTSLSALRGGEKGE